MTSRTDAERRTARRRWVGLVGLAVVSIGWWLIFAEEPSMAPLLISLGFTTVSVGLAVDLWRVRRR
ncbi:hypothetical protein [Cellulomonas rhizosphaerae]|uniref:hypothetical protein n=1 Tax=Cellulomonas rhizosphaerae TaxID=2293719 RepID=UPI0010FD2EEE|nr:hypothetical protein [Cellulomonas rhizosphaerae]